MFKEIFRKVRYGGIKALITKDILPYAAQTGNVPLMDHFLTRNNINNQDTTGNTVLHYVIENQHKYQEGEVLHTVKELLKWDAKLDIVNNGGNAPLDVAGANFNFSIIELLQQHGAESSKPDLFRAQVKHHESEVKRKLAFYKKLEDLVAHDPKASKLDQTSAQLADKPLIEKSTRHVHWAKEIQTFKKLVSVAAEAPASYAVISKSLKPGSRQLKGLCRV
ncbi:ankyrin repeat domain-containing protein [Candidatus Tisiphia endosymbiont of Nemotelus uliginosus]|uniref:ankyrin repeat domain-containing protein n=1 Tax=Candidatus Tisiphia endosymbiont of Nemotelus uliginosus TaxID=3077926 RepID=UPI0035C93B89